MASDGSGGDTESLFGLDEFLTFSFDPDISDNQEVGGQEKADRLGLALRALSLQAIIVGYHSKDLE